MNELEDKTVPSVLRKVHNLSFLEATKIQKISTDTTLYSSKCQQVLKAYSANIDLAIGMTTLPAFALWTAMEWIRAGTMAKNDMLGANATHDQIAHAAQQLGQRAEHYMAQAMRIPRDAQVRHLVESTRMLEVFSVQAGPIAHGALEGVLKSIVIQTWGAFEVLSEDLLTGVLSAHSRCFSQVENLRLRFRSRRNIRAAYVASFPTNNASILAAVEDQSLDALALIRNLLVHKAGHADGDFLAEAAKSPLLSPFTALSLNDSLQLNGWNVNAIMVPAIKAGSNLITAVDQWIRRFENDPAGCGSKDPIPSAAAPNPPPFRPPDVSAAFATFPPDLAS